MMNSILTDQIDLLRLDADRKLSPDRRIDLGQFMTPAPIARFMASLFGEFGKYISLLDPGAGVGSLTAAFMEEVVGRRERPTSVRMEAWELDDTLHEYLTSTLVECRKVTKEIGISFNADIHKEDFVEAAADILHDENSLFPKPVQRYTHCIMNPPYRKINSSSDYRIKLRSVGIETSNLYTGFLVLAVMLLEPGGELVAIVPRSFCNGVYFKAFRRFFLREMIIRHIHIFGSRNRAFEDNDVLQENIILHAIRGGNPGKVIVTSSTDSNMDDLTTREIDFDQVVRPGDSNLVINIVSNETDQLVTEQIRLFSHSLYEMSVEVSTGPVVDFRSLNDIRTLPIDGTAPLIYPAHFSNGFIRWPMIGGRKPNAIIESDSSQSLLMPNGWYVLTRRFSSKEEKRRIVVAINDPDRISAKKIGFENHLNVYHIRGKGLDPLLAKGLAVYLSSTLVDLYFRQFSGHTQVNASDLRSLPYPDPQTLKRIGSRVGAEFPNQKEIDLFIEEEIATMADDTSKSPVQVQVRIQEALDILADLGLPRAQRNDRSALTLLALLDLKPDELWSEARNPLIGITPIMEFTSEYYGRKYAPNSRETFRRFTMHQFVQAGIAILNPDAPERPVNSPATVYQIEDHLLELLRHKGEPVYNQQLTSYKGIRETLADQYAMARKMNLVPLQLPGETLHLTPGHHSRLIKAIVEEFGPRFAPGAEVLYVGDTGAKMVHFNQPGFNEIGLVFDSHGKFPDVILFWRERNWLLLIEAVTSHGPVDPKRYTELAELFKGSKAGLVYVTAFPDRQTMARYLSEISWETEVWCADTPSHLIHFNGERFLGPRS